MSEDLSRLMDGELDDDGLDRLAPELRDPQVVATWACWHAIGDTMRGTRVRQDGFCARFSARLAAEPTVLAPQARARRPALAWAWAAAAGIAAAAVVGWTALAITASPPVALAAAGKAGAVRSADVRSAPSLPQDYLIAHQEYSPATALQGVQPYLRAVSSPAGDVRP